jgi:PKD repeat protein
MAVMRDKIFRFALSISMMLVFAFGAVNLYAAEIWVATDGSDELGDGSFDNPYGTIVYAVTVVSANDTVTVKPGTYNPGGTAYFYSNIHLRSQFGPDSTTLSGAAKYAIISVEEFAGRNVIEGFTMLIGRPGIDARYGTFNSELIIRNNRFEQCANATDTTGGAILIRSCDNFSIYENTFTDNFSSASGGAISVSSSTGEIYENEFTSNTCETGGGAIYAYSNDIRCYNNIFTSNAANLSFSRGGAIALAYTYGDFPYWVIQNNIFKLNQAGLGGAVSVAANAAYVYNNLFYDNLATNSGGGIQVEYDYDPYIYNNIFLGNTPEGMYSSASQMTHYDNNNYYDNGPDSNGCLNCPPAPNIYYYHPRIANIGAGDYHLTDESQLINRGRFGLPEQLNFDYENQDRRLAGGTDIGPDEYADCSMSGNFSAINDTSGCPGLRVEFNALNLQGYYDSLRWEFGDGKEAINVLNPPNTYQDTGTYTVKLHMVTPCTTVVITKENYVHIMTEPAPDFQADVTSGCTPLTVEFENMTDGTGEQYLWDFGDTTTSTDINPTHIYENPGIYEIQLTAINSCGEATAVKTGYINAISGAVADFSAEPMEGSAPLFVDFFDASLYSPLTWLWQFGDGGTSDEQNPRHRYLTPGIYDVTLMCQNDCGDVPDTLTKSDYITIYGFNPEVYNVLDQRYTYRYDFFLDSLYGLFDRTISLRAAVPVQPNRGQVTVGFGDSTVSLFDSTSMMVSMTEDVTRGDYEVLLISSGSGGFPVDTQSLQFTSTADSLIETTPLALDFGEVPEDSTKTLNIAVRNNVQFPDTFSLNITGMNTDPPVFDVDFPGSFVLDLVNKSREVPVSFTPGELGEMNGTLTIISNDPAYPQWTVNLTGTGIMERTPPLVDSTLPLDEEQEYAVTDSVDIYFSEPIDQSTLQPGAVTVTSLRTGNEVEGELVYHAENYVLTFKPQNGFAITDSIEIVLNAQIADVAGNTLDGNGDGTGEGTPDDNYVFIFTTGLAVYPGDANNDGIVNEMDVLPIGVYWGSSGDARSTSASLWTRQAVKSWTPVKATYADCNGDGTVNSDDLTQIENHWGMTHEIEGVPTAFTMDELEEHSRDFEEINEHLEDMSLGSRGDKIHEILSTYLVGQSNIERFSLGRNFPNPFNPITTIDFSIPRECHVTLEVYNVLGQTVKMLVNESMSQGYHSVTWDATNDNGNPVPTGVYFYRMTADEFNMVRKMLLIR